MKQLHAHALQQQYQISFSALCSSRHACFMLPIKGISAILHPSIHASNQPLLPSQLTCSSCNCNTEFFLWFFPPEKSRRPALTSNSSSKTRIATGQLAPLITRSPMTWALLMLDSSIWIDVSNYVSTQHCKCGNNAGSTE